MAVARYRMICLVLEVKVMRRDFQTCMLRFSCKHLETLHQKRTQNRELQQFNHTSWMTIVTPTDRHKSVRNRCLVERFCCVFMLSLDFHFLMVWGLCHRILPFSLIIWYYKNNNNLLNLNTISLQRLTFSMCHLNLCLNENITIL